MAFADVSQVDIDPRDIDGSLVVAAVIKPLKLAVFDDDVFLFEQPQQNPCTTSGTLLLHWSKTRHLQAAVCQTLQPQFWLHQGEGVHTQFSPQQGHQGETDPYLLQSDRMGQVSGRVDVESGNANSRVPTIPIGLKFTDTNGVFRFLGEIPLELRFVVRQCGQGHTQQCERQRYQNEESGRHVQRPATDVPCPATYVNSETLDPSSHLCACEMSIDKMVPDVSS